MCASRLNIPYVPRAWREKSKAAGFLTAGIAFAILGLLVAWVFAIPATRELVRVFDWVETPCAIIKSHLAKDELTHTWNLSLEYQYAYPQQSYQGTGTPDGRTYISGRYSPFRELTWSISRDMAARRFQAAAPAGMRTVCYVNPNNPSEAMLRRNPYGDLFSSISGAPILLMVACIFFRSGLSRWKKVKHLSDELGPGLKAAFWAIMLGSWLVMSAILCVNDAYREAPPGVQWIMVFGFGFMAVLFAGCFCSAFARWRGWLHPGDIERHIAKSMTR